MAVRIRMKKMGRKHRPFFRIVAIDGRQPRDGRVIEELGFYDPMMPNTDPRQLQLNRVRIAYWLSVGAQPSAKVRILLGRRSLRVATSTSLTASVATNTAGQPQTFTATVTSGTGTPTGQVRFRDGTNSLGSAPLDGDGQAMLVHSALAVGTHLLIAAYPGSVDFLSSNSVPFSFTVNRAETNTTLTISAATSINGQAMTFTAAVTSSAGCATGQVTFNDGSNVLGSATLDGHGQAMLVVDSLAIGTHHVSAIYSGSADCQPSASAPASVRVVIDFPEMFPDIRNKVHVLLVKRGFQATDVSPNTTIWECSPTLSHGLWGAWGGPRWVLTGDHRSDELWFGVEQTLLLHALQDALKHVGFPNPPPDLFAALTQLGDRVQELEDWRNWTERFQYGEFSYLAAQYGVRLTDQNLEYVISDVVDGVATFLGSTKAQPAQPWAQAPKGFTNELERHRIPDPKTCPGHSFLVLSLWLVNRLCRRGYTRVRVPPKMAQWFQRQPSLTPNIRVISDEGMNQSLSWHPRDNSNWNPEERALKLCFREEGIYWFGVRQDYANQLKVPVDQFAPQRYTIIQVWFNGFWVRDTQRSHQALRDLLKYL